MTTGNLAPHDQAFVEAVASAMATVGMLPTAARLYGYLMLQTAPVGLDRIADDLAMSKGGAWNAARVLERYGQARRHGERGSKRALFSLADNFGLSFSAQTGLFDRLGAVLDQGAADPALAAAAARLAAGARFYRAVRAGMQDLLRDLGPGLRADLAAGDAASMARASRG